jgi:multidrug efflux pump subunit AcrA (membrane-fusion protein)
MYRPLLSTKLCTLFLLCMCYWPARAQPPAAPIVASRVIYQEISASRTYVGTVLPLKRVVVGSAVDGRVVKVVAEVGDRVEAKQPLVQLLTETMELEKKAAVAELELRKEELAELEAGTRREEIDQAKAKMMAAEAMMTYSAARRARNKQLFDQSKSVSLNDLEESVALAVQTAQLYTEAKAAYDLAVAGPRAEEIAQARSRVAIQEALIRLIEDRTAKHTIITRFPGYVIAEHAQEGQWVKKGDPVSEVVALDIVEIEAFVVAEHVPFIRSGMNVRVEIAAFPNRIFTGVVSAVIAQADVRSRTFPVRLRMANDVDEAGPMLKAGMYARVALPTSAKTHGLLVEKDALVFGGTQPIVFSIEGDKRHGIVNAIPVDLGVAVDNLIHVKGDLKPGQLVVIEGNERLKPAQEVSILRIEEPSKSSPREHDDTN